MYGISRAENCIHPVCPVCVLDKKNVSFNSDLISVIAMFCPVTVLFVIFYENSTKHQHIYELFNLAHFVQNSLRRFDLIHTRLRKKSLPGNS